MPLLQINTNISVDDINRLASNASKLIAGILGKPESYVMVNIRADEALSFAGTNEPCAHLKLKSLGLNESDTAAYSDKLCQFVTQQLGIPSSRIYIEYSSPERHMWGWDSRTF